MRRWLEEDNGAIKIQGIKIQGIRWLLKELASGKRASSLVIDLTSAEEIEK